MTLFCDLFGHKFIGTTEIDEYGRRIKERLKFCIRCGLSKEEIFETTLSKSKEYQKEVKT